MRVGGFIISTSDASRALGLPESIAKADLTSVIFATELIAERYGAKLELVNYPKLSEAQKDTRLLIVTRSALLTYEEFRWKAGKDMRSLPQFCEDGREESTKCMLKSLGLPISFVTCYIHDDWLLNDTLPCA